MLIYHHWDPIEQHTVVILSNVMHWRHCSWAYRGPLTGYVKLRVAHAPGMPGRFSPPPLVSDPDVHHGTCVNVPGRMPGSLTSVSFEVDGGENSPAFPKHPQPAILHIWQEAHAQSCHHRGLERDGLKVFWSIVRKVVIRLTHGVVTCYFPLQVQYPHVEAFRSPVTQISSMKIVSVMALRYGPVTVTLDMLTQCKGFPHFTQGLFPS